MFKTSLKALLLLVPSIAYAQNLNATEGEAQAAPMNQDTISVAQDQVDWSALEQLVQGSFCSQNATMEAFLANSTNPYLLP